MKGVRFHPATEGWFQTEVGQPTEIQRRGWAAIQSGHHTLISAPTGSGKTLAAFLAFLDRLFQEGLAGHLESETTLVYVSPLKALSNDIHKNLQEPLEGINTLLEHSGHSRIDIRAAVRTGDTPASVRQKLLRRPPQIIVTTPESLFLLLTSDGGRRLLGTTRAVIVDEIHALAGNRRGSHLSLSLERLESLMGRDLQRIGLSATQKPLEEVARFLVGSRSITHAGTPKCRIIRDRAARKIDLRLELPDSPLEAVMSNEVWAEEVRKLGDLIGRHRTTLIFVNTRRLAERLTHQLSQLLGEGWVTSHHGSLSMELRLRAEDRLKRGEIRALIATASLELGIDVGAIDLVCQIGSPRSINSLLQRVGRAGHYQAGISKGYLFPLTRDELAECTALLRAVQQRELEAVEIPLQPLDILAQQIVASAASETWAEADLYNLLTRAYPYRTLSFARFHQVVRVLAQGFDTQRGRRNAHIHYDGVNGRLRGRRGARLAALTSGGAIPDSSDYTVVQEPAGTVIGSVNEDFAVESLSGDIFQLGNRSWRILKVGSGVMRVEDADGQPPSVPFWLGEAPGRSTELCQMVSELREGLESRFSQAASSDEVVAWLTQEWGLAAAAADQLAQYHREAYQTLGALPTQQRIVLERFFDASGGMQLILHAPFGSRINRAWGLALRKRFCRTFNFELQAAATEDAILLSLGSQHSFPLTDVFRYLKAATVRDLLVQAVLDTPMFTLRWRWNALRSLAILRRKGGRKNPAVIQRMEAEDLTAAIFPDQLACQENLSGDREIPDHPLVDQTLHDCLHEAMDVGGLTALLKAIEEGGIDCVAHDLTEPSPLAQEILRARPYSFLDNAPAEERRTQAVYSRHSSAAEPGSAPLDPAAVDKVVQGLRPEIQNADELHDWLLLVGVLTDEEIGALSREPSPHDAPASPAERPDTLLDFLDQLKQEDRVVQVTRRFDGRTRSFWIATERIELIRSIDPDAALTPSICPPPEGSVPQDRQSALIELVRGRMEMTGPIQAAALAERLALEPAAIESALRHLEAEGTVLRGAFSPGAQGEEWCHRRILARIHRMTLERLRAEIQPVPIADYLRFLLAWQGIDSEYQVQGQEGLASIAERLEGYEIPAGLLEPELLVKRVSDYQPEWLDQLCLAGRVGWGRLSPPDSTPVEARRSGRRVNRVSPIALFPRQRASDWLSLNPIPDGRQLSFYAREVLGALNRRGASFFMELVTETGLLKSHVEEALGELVGAGWVTADSFAGLRAFLVPAHRRSSRRSRRGSGPTLPSVETAGRWAPLRRPQSDASTGDPDPAETKGTETCAWTLLRRYGVVFRRLLGREPLACPWRELARVYRNLELQGEIRAGQFVAGVGGEQFALPEAVGLLRKIRRQPRQGDPICLSAIDPVNLTGILTPGPRIPNTIHNRVLLRDGVPIAALIHGEYRRLDPETRESDTSLRRALEVRSLPTRLEPYYS